MTMTATLNQETLKKKLLQYGYNFDDLARKAGVTKTTLRRGFNGRPVKPRTVKKIADVLDVDPLDIATTN